MTRSNVRCVIVALAASVCLLAVAVAGAPAMTVRTDEDWPKYTQFLRGTNATGYVFGEAANPPLAVTVIYNASLETLGWDYLYVAPEPSLLANNPAEAYHAAGYAEGFVTYKRIWSSHNNTARGFSFFTPLQLQAFNQWMAEHMAFVESYGDVSSSDPFKAQLGKLLLLVRGIAAGYMAAVRASPHAKDPSWVLHYADVFLINFGPEIMDVFNVLPQGSGSGSGSGNGTVGADAGAASSSTNRAAAAAAAQRRAGEHCSALVKVVTDADGLPKDLFVAQVTWGPFEMMTRVFKVYAFETSVQFSGYPGCIASGDDWYVTSNGLAVQETTLTVYNTTLYDVLTPRSVSEFLRVMIATYLAKDAPTWVQLFSKQNSGTYNDIYMIINMNLFTPGKPILNDTFWLAEQLPGSVTSADLSSVLRETTYFASYNIPYFPEVFNASGNLQQEQEFGAFFSFTNYSRALIFARNQSDVTDIESMKRLMRYNNWEFDPLSAIQNCTGTKFNNTCDPANSAMQAIASRGDLAPNWGTGHLGPLAPYVALTDTAALDAKIATWSGMQGGFSNFTVFAISGPTYDQQPVFNFSTAPASLALPHMGLPDSWHFPWVEYTTPKTLPKPNGTSGTGGGGSMTTEPGSSHHTVAVAVGIIGSALAAIIVVVVLVKSRQGGYVTISPVEASPLVRSTTAV